MSACLSSASRRKPLGLAFGGNGGLAMDMSSSTKPAMSLGLPSLGLPSLGVAGPHPSVALTAATGAAEAEDVTVEHPDTLPLPADTSPLLHSHGQLASMGHPTQM